MVEPVNAAQTAPPGTTSMMMGIWYLGSSVGHYLGGILGTYYGSMSHDTFFAALALLAGTNGMLMGAISGRLQRMLTPARIWSNPALLQHRREGGSWMLITKDFIRCSRCMYKWENEDVFVWLVTCSQFRKASNLSDGPHWLVSRSGWTLWLISQHLLSTSVIAWFPEIFVDTFDQRAWCVHLITGRVVIGTPC